MEEINEAFGFTIQADDQHRVGRRVPAQYFALPGIESQMPDDGEHEIYETCVHQQKTAEETIMQKVVCEREERGREYAGKQDVREILLVGLNARQAKYSELEHRCDPERRNDEHRLQISIQREIRGDDESDANEVSNGVRRDEERDVREEPAQKQERTAHGR